MKNRCLSFFENRYLLRTTWIRKLILYVRRRKRHEIRVKDEFCLNCACQVTKVRGVSAREVKNQDTNLSGNRQVTGGHGYYL